MVPNPDTVSPPAGNCLTAPRIYEIAFNAGSWTFEESEHLLTCPRCKNRLTSAFAAVHARETAEQRYAAVLTLLAVYAQQSARQALVLPRPSVRCDTGPTRDDAFVALDFPDPNLRAVVSRGEDSSYRLHVEHRELPPGSLVLAMVKTPDASRVVWARFVMLRQGGRHALGHVRLDDTVLTDVQGRLFVGAVVAPPAEAADLLRESFLHASEDDPESVSAWRNWARSVLDRGAADEGLRPVLEPIRDAEPDSLADDAQVVDCGTPRLTAVTTEAQEVLQSIGCW